MGRFAIVDEETIRNGDCTDVYFVRTGDILERTGHNPPVVMEVTAGWLTGGWGVFCGLNDVIALLNGRPVDVHAMPEGTIFRNNEPVLRIEGRYCDIARFETAILGFVCHASGIASAAARIRSCAGGRSVYSFGSRRQHPAIATMVERAAWIGGVDGVSNTCAPEDLPRAGTMPHSYVLCCGTPEEAFRLFAREAPADIPRIMLADTCCDEKREALAAARAGATAVRLDTPRSRRGDMRAIIEEVRWELDAAGYPGVGIFLSGGVTREDVVLFRDIIDAFGIGGAIANAPVIDFAMDIVERDGIACAKRGKRSGAKQVYLLPGGEHRMAPASQPPPPEGVPLLQYYIKGGKVLRDSPLTEARERVISALDRMETQESP
ncbi:MAG: nicotinate phosphoribosyltransferase [Methanoregulaceae archaeon]|nr:nicotinate phosphoribosyltransferase [Methanoregulaceae archaeon]